MGNSFAIGDRVISKNGGDEMLVISVRSSGRKRCVVFCAYGPVDHRVIRRHFADELAKVPSPERGPWVRSL